jgi:hypothetical protein
MATEVLRDVNLRIERGVSAGEKIPH